MLQAFQGSVFHFLGDPAGVPQGLAYEYFSDGLLLIEDGHVKAVGSRTRLAPTLPEGTPIEIFPDGLIVPGFIDTHIHYPQIDVIASHGKSLLDWLDSYTFPAEQAFADPAYATAAADFFLDQLLANGTTTALVFATIHAHAADALFAAAQMRNMRLITGKVLMDQNAPQDLCDVPGGGYEESAALIRKWHGRDRLSYAVTPRFAVSSTAAQLAVAGRLVKQFDDVYVQTHLSESEAEIELSATLHPEARDYLDIYDRHGLLTNRSVFAHGIHLSDDERRRLAAAGASIAFCPTSNLFLGNGLFDVEATKHALVKLGLSTDVGGGTSFSLFSAMNEGYKVARLLGQTLDPLQTFYLATLGGAHALNLDRALGNFELGKEGDFIVLDRKATPLLARRIALCNTIEEEIFALSMLGDDRVISATYVMGVSAKCRAVV